MTTAAVECLHLRRILSTPNGPTVTGVCTGCGDVRVYSSSGDAQITSEWAQAQVNRTANSLASRAAKKGAFNTAPLGPRREQSYVLPVHEPMGSRRDSATGLAMPVRLRSLNPEQVAYLEYVRANGEVKARRVAEHFGDKYGSAAMRLQSLVLRGYLERVADDRTAGDISGAYTYRVANNLDNAAALDSPAGSPVVSPLTPEGAAVRGGKGGGV
jgi:hypothetical protein